MPKCKLAATSLKLKGWTVVGVSTDEAGSGCAASAPGLLSALQSVRSGKAAVLLAQDLARFSRDAAKLQAIHARLHFLKAQIVTVDEGLITDLHVAADQLKSLLWPLSVSVPGLGRTTCHGSSALRASQGSQRAGEHDAHQGGGLIVRCAIYARYSSDNQREASIEDQLRICSARADREGWQAVQVFQDAAVSGATTLRPGYQALLAAMRQGAFDVVLAESLDRFSRDQEHIAAFYKQAVFAGVRVVTLAEGEVGELHIG
jgi:DNA invertase Pin-like site-specific DNA recombinase